MMARAGAVARDHPVRTDAEIRIMVSLTDRWWLEFVALRNQRNHLLKRTYNDHNQRLMIIMFISIRALEHPCE